MSTFSALDIARTGVGFSQYWSDTLAHNIANANTVRPGDEEPFRARLVVATELNTPLFAPTGSGVAVGRIVERQGEPARAYDPGNPQADEDGYVTLPLVDLAGQMSDLILANRTYQLNLKVMEGAKEAYMAALRIGQR